MRTIEVRNINYAYAEAIRLLLKEGRKQDSRAGEVLTLDTPVMTVYHRPWERVLFDEKRDANPFFHLMESLWMLSGRDDAAFLNTYVRDFGARFAEPDGRIHGAYGKRWRSWFGMDQIKVICERLKKDPHDRRVVLQMWDPEDDLGANYRDLPCNINAFIRIVNGCLDLTVMCRSNDAVWGAYGANAVHFSILQEYMALQIGVPMGFFYQFSNNLHIYTRILPKVGIPELTQWVDDRYTIGVMNLKSLSHYESIVEWDKDLSAFMVFAEDNPEKDSYPYVNEWFTRVASPMVIVHRLFSSGQLQKALEYCDNIAATDWQEACRAWIRRRINRARSSILQEQRDKMVEVKDATR